MKVLVLGLGNPLFGDDGLGSCAAEALRGSDEVKVVNGTVGSSNLALYLEGFDEVIFIDVDLGLKEPFVLEELEPSTHVEPDPHKNDPQTILTLAKAMGIFEGKAYVLKIKGYKMCFPCAPTEEGLKNLEKALRFLEKKKKVKVFRTVLSSCASSPV